jgi:hypothetical protein
MKLASGQLSNGCILEPQLMDEVVEIVAHRYLAARRIITLKLHNENFHSA